MKKLGGKQKFKAGGKSPRNLAIRPQRVRDRHEMHPGNIYEGWFCENEQCGLVIAAHLTRPGSLPVLEEPDDYLAKCRCPHCQTVGLYRWNARKDLTYTAEPKPS